MPPKELWTAISQYGFPMVGLVVLSIGVYKVFCKMIWPRFEKIMDSAEERLTKQSGEFLEALKRRDAIMTEEFGKLHVRLDRDQAENRVRRPQR